jgi:hypothetical protein
MIVLGNWQWSGHGWLPRDVMEKAMTTRHEKTCKP